MVYAKKWKKCLRTLWVLVAFAAIIPGASAQEQGPKVAILPFVIHSQADQAATRKSLEEVLVKLLAAEGVKVVDPQEVHKVLKPGESVQTEEHGRSIGGRIRADYVVVGSFNQIGSSISLDGKLVDVSGRKRTETLFAEERGVENLAAAGGRLVQQMSVHLLAKGIIADVKVRGNDRIEADAIKATAKSKKGEILKPDQLREDIKAIYKMGYFEKVDADITDSAGGKVLTFVVQENPVVQELRVGGNKKIKEKDILAAISTRQYAVLQQNVVSEDVQKILKLYEQKGYFNADVRSSVEFPKDPRKATVVFTVKENKKVYIKKITFRGNKNLSARKLRGVMQTKKKSIMSLLTDRGILQKEMLEADVERLTAYYHDKGFMDAKVGSPEISRRDEGFQIEIPVEEGERYRVSDVQFTGDMLDKSDKIAKKINVKKKGYFSRDTLRRDLDYLNRTYMDEGYAKVEVTPLVKRETSDRTTTVTYDVKKNELVQIGRVFITGNTKTRDYVIRREVKLFEGDTFNATKLEQSLTRLKKLDFFEEVEMVPVATDNPAVMNIHVKVREKLTGSISVGGGFSSDDGLFASGQIMQRNLFGRGQYVGLKAYFGQEAQRYIGSFTEPWMFGYPVAGGIDIYNWLREYQDFTKDALGFRLRTAYPFGNYSRVNAFYTFEQANVTDIPEGAPEALVAMEGYSVKSSITIGAERDTTNHHFLPTKGMISAVSMEYTSPALGSDSNFLKFEGHTGVYIPLVWKLVGFVRGEVGWIKQLGDGPVDDEIPIYERFFLGGINSLRGWQWGEVGPEVDGYITGGISYTVLNVEVLFPIYEKMGIRGVLFFDAGNAFPDENNFDIAKFRTDIGGGIRWNSPFGPLRIEVGIPLDPRDGDDAYAWQFSAGAFF